MKIQTLNWLNAWMEIYDQIHNIEDLSRAHASIIWIF